MPSTLCLSISFLDAAFHGRGDGGAPEWPPSPLRLFQALVATAAARSPQALAESSEFAALRWLESLPPPVICAPRARTAQAYRLSVPNNAMDIVGRAWSRGNLEGKGDADPRTHRTMKSVQPSRIPEGTAVRYLWQLPSDPPNEVLAHLERLPSLVRSLVAVGWGCDFVAADAVVRSHDIAESFDGDQECWSPVHSAGTSFRVPKQGTLDALATRHAAFLKRCAGEGLTPVPPLPPTAYSLASYGKDGDARARPFAAFQLLQLDATGMRPFDPRRGRVVAGMLRHAASTAARDSRRHEDFISRFILGHGEAAGSDPVPVGPQRFAFVPVPSIEGRGGWNSRVVGSIRRVLLTTFAEECDAEIAWARRMLNGRDLVDERSGESKAILSLLPANDRMIQNYVRAASVWMTVSPVVLPGYDDPGHYRRRLRKGADDGIEQGRWLKRLSDRIDSLLRKAIRQAGFSASLAEHAEIEWRATGFLAGVNHADRYFTPDHLRRFSRYHVRIAWKDAAGHPVRVRGPICLGGGRYQGLGLFAAAD